MKRIITLLLLASITFLFTNCAPSIRFTSKNDTPPPGAKISRTNNSDNNTDAVNEADTDNASILETQTGVASYYAEAFHGKQTSNGEIYDMYGISAAHQTYPEGTIVRVTNLENNKSVVLRINDRMPYHDDRIIDLSYGAAEKLDMLQSGLANVRVEVIKWGEGK